MALSTRKLLELSFLSLVDSGIDYRGQNVGCYMSGISHDIHTISGQDESEAQGSFACLPAMIANRISYHLDLRGPSIPVDTACSSSLVATHLAVQALKQGECKAAIVGGAQINSRFVDWLNYTQGGILSADGRCKPFDSSADGFSRGEGAVVVVLKPIGQAIQDGDHIYGTILGTGVNSSGALAPVNAPVASAQEEAMVRAFREASRRPDEVDFIELHATGTARGDPTEANWIGSAFKRDDDLLIGSVKGNIGHLEIAAFLASLVKVCGIFETGLIPPTINLNTPNPAIKWEQYRLRAPTKLTPLPCRSSSGRSLVAMTSSGIGGANGHCVVESPPSPLERYSRKGSPFWTAEMVPSTHLLVVGGLSPRSTADIINTICDKDIHQTEVPSLALAYGRRARSMTWRSFAVVDAGKDIRFSDPALATKTKHPIVFVFSGQGPQHIDMGRQLFRTCQVFRESVLECDDIYQKITGVSLISCYGLFDDVRTAESLDETWPIALTLPALTIVQLALFDTLVDLGIKPDAVVGHSAGETAVLYASGAGSKAAAIQLSIARGRSLSSLEACQGTMAALSCNVQEAERIIQDVAVDLGPGCLEIACYNADKAITLSGIRSHVERAVEIASAAGIFARTLRTRVPVHSSMMKLVQKDYTRLVSDALSGHALHDSSIPVFSCESGGLLQSKLDADYFWANTRGPVRFRDAISTVIEEKGEVMFVELGPHPVLSGYLSEIGGKKSLVVCPMRRANPKKQEAEVEVHTMLTALGKLAVAGCNSIDYARLVGPNIKPSRSLPPYPLAPKQIAYYTPSHETSRYLQRRRGPLNYPQLRVNGLTHPDLAQHIIKGEPIMPAAGYLEMALEFGARKIWDVDFLSIIALSSPRPVPIDVTLVGNRWTVRSSSSSESLSRGRADKDNGQQFDRLHATGFLTLDVSEEERAPASVDLEAVRSRSKAVDATMFYPTMAHFAGYGHQYQRIVSIRQGSDGIRDEALIGVRGMDAELRESPRYVLHPAILDAAIHATVHPRLTGCTDKRVYYLPSKVKSVIIHDAYLSCSSPELIYVHIIQRSWTPTTMVYDCVLSGPEGTKLLSIAGLEVARHGDPSANATIEKRHTLAYETTEKTVTRTSPTDVSCQVTTPADSASFRHFPYQQGREIDLQRRIAELDPLSDIAAWFTAEEGIDGQAARGFTRSIRREYPAWRVKLAVFDRFWSKSDHVGIARELSSWNDAEDEILVSPEGKVCVPRLRSLSPPSSRVPFCPEKPWILGDGGVCHTSSPPTSSKDVRVSIKVSGFRQCSDSLFIFLGHTAESNDAVMGITGGPIANFIMSHPDSLSPLPSDPEYSESAPPLTAIAIIAISMGISAIIHPERLRRRRIIVTHADRNLGRDLVKILHALCLDVTAIASTVSIYDLSVYTGTGASFILSGYNSPADIDILAGALDANGKMFLWDHPTTGLMSYLEREPWNIGDALRLSSSTPSLRNIRHRLSAPLSLVPHPPTLGEMVPSVGNLFCHEKAYLLVGGIGSVGFQIALWMYEHGARHIVMTSRSGRDGLRKRDDSLSLRALAYMESLSDLDLKLHAVDAVSLPEMTSLVQSCAYPISGCMLLTAVLRDRTFAHQTQESFDAVYESKIEAFRVLSEALPIDSLDWFVAFTSVSGFFGSAGQTNYAAANVALEGLVEPYPNAFAMVAPMIIDSTIADPRNASHLRHLSDWGFTARELCNCIEDGIRRLADGPFGLYVPDFHWNRVAGRLGRSPVFEHLLTPDEPSEGAEINELTLDHLVMHELDISPDNFSPAVPLTSYGLDSLSAARLSAALRPFLEITQMQLLADVSLNDIRTRTEEKNLSSASPAQDMTRKNLRPQTGGFDWKNFHRSGETIIKIVDTDDHDAIPLILIHGTSGNGQGFYPLKDMFTTPLWMMQTTPETPFGSMNETVEFYHREIKAARPKGPYRLGVFCATSPMAVELVRKFERGGDCVLQLAFLDHFPSIFCEVPGAPDAQTLRDGAMSSAYIKDAFNVLLQAYEDDRAPSRQRMKGELLSSFLGEPVRPSIQVYHDNFVCIVGMIVKYLLEAVPAEVRAEVGDDPGRFASALKDVLAQRMRELKAPFTVYKAQCGVLAANDTEHFWADFGVEERNIVQVPGGHFDMFQQERLARSLEYDWKF
ncbi:polyketide synthase [Punctularia strigosozonata HHB-11173 SS5]|uniref:polyketide synthase n=1 Tax=Punctularia strigosozonata (strain HHB-11173) TaxID=741275 RepID=UPI00044162DE|nr:polyketide synthase [Punctularia strigosozonata HHB-11173 SS5]EIN05362.1 polyketide synthase [Punctularia strigosozonata HHB-11173 SS5]